MPTTQSAYDWLRSRAVPGPAPRDDPQPPAPVYGPERDGRAEVERLRREIEDLVTMSPGARPRAAIDSALDAVSRLRVVSANLDACKPPLGERMGRALVDLADRRLHGHADAIERGMTYTADNTMRLLARE